MTPSPTVFARRGLIRGLGALALSASPVWALREEWLLTHLPVDDSGLAEPHPARGALFLGDRDPNQAEGFYSDYRVKAQPLTDVTHGWRLQATRIVSASGASIHTARLHLRPHRGRQRHDWRDQPGWLGHPDDFRDFEFTVFFRVSGRVSGQRAQVAFKLRGGQHSQMSPHNASCSFVTWAPIDRGHTSRFGKELTHPLYDHVVLSTRSEAGLQEGVWQGAKVLSWRTDSGVVTQLWVQRDPLAPLAHPGGNSRWHLHSEYMDRPGVSTGRYQTVVDWGGWQTTLRADGYELLDFYRPSLVRLAHPLVPKPGFQSAYL